MIVLGKCVSFYVSYFTCMNHCSRNMIHRTGNYRSSTWSKYLVQIYAGFYLAIRLSHLYITPNYLNHRNYIHHLLCTPFLNVNHSHKMGGEIQESKQKHGNINKQSQCSVLYDNPSGWTRR